jgi:hypothetical protein
MVIDAALEDLTPGSKSPQVSQGRCRQFELDPLLLPFGAALQDIGHASAGKSRCDGVGEGVKQLFERRDLSARHIEAVKEQCQV